MGIETVIAGASLAATLGSGVMGAQGARTSADAQAQSYAYKAQVARNNAIIAGRNAEAATGSGQQQAQTQDIKTKAMVGEQLVAQAANGLDVGSGTNVDVRQSAEDLGKLDTLTILNNALKTSSGFKTQAMNFLSESQVENSASTNAHTAGDYNVASSLLGTAGSFATKWAGYSRSGVFS